MPRYLVGIDLGTTNSAVAFVDLAQKPKAGEPDLNGLYASSVARIGKARRELFGDGPPDLNAVHQGKTGDCFCLAPLGALVSRDPAAGCAAARPFRPVSAGDGRRTVRIVLTYSEMAISGHGTGIAI